MPNIKGNKHTLEARLKMSIAGKGRKKTEATKLKMSFAAIGRKKNWTPEWREKIRQSQIGSKRSLATRKKMRDTALRIGKVCPHRPKGYVMSEESKNKLSETRIRLKISSGENNWNWKGGITPEIKLIRNSKAYQNWRNAVIKRDNYTCLLCGMIGGWNKKMKKQIKIEAHHIKAFSQYPELRFDIGNGRTLCRKCHEETDNWGPKANV